MLIRYYNIQVLKNVLIKKYNKIKLVSGIVSPDLAKDRKTELPVGLN